MTSIYAPISATCYPNSASGLSTASPRSHPPARKPLTEKSSDIPRRITAAGRRAYVGLAIRIHSSFQLSNFVTALPLPQAPSLKFSHAKKDTTVAPRGGGWKDANLKTDRRTVAMGRLVVSRCCWIALIYANIKNPFSEPCYGLTPFLVRLCALCASARSSLPRFRQAGVRPSCKNALLCFIHIYTWQITAYSEMRMAHQCIRLILEMAAAGSVARCHPFDL